MISVGFMFRTSAFSCKYATYSRLLSKKADVIRNAVLRGRNVGDITLALSDAAVTSPVDGTSHGLNPVPDSSDDAMLFMKSTHQVLRLSRQCVLPEEKLTLFLAGSKELINIKFKQADMADQKTRKGKQVEVPQSVQSIDEFTWRRQKTPWQETPSLYMKLAKIRLTGLVVVTTMGGYMISPGLFDPGVFCLAALGTGLLSCSANTLNQFFEVPFDSQMRRTKNRPLVKAEISSGHAVVFAVSSATIGAGLLYMAVNPLTCLLGIVNLVLYTAVYTPMKRVSILNTWVGSIVGSIPPMMGWTACTGALQPGAWLLGALLFCWQFPHFNALSWNLRADYSRGGYHMASVKNPRMCRRVAFRHCLYLTLLCSMAPLLDVTTWAFAVNALPLNVYFSYLGWRFYRDSDSASSRRLFLFSLVHLPVMLLLMLISKKTHGGPDTLETINDGGGHTPHNTKHR